MSEENEKVKIHFVILKDSKFKGQTGSVSPLVSGHPVFSGGIQ